MSFEQISLNPAEWQQLLPMATFNPNSTFGRRLLEKREEKQKAAWYTATKWFSAGRPSAFITDGSSTFYICLAVLAMTTEGKPTIVTNNLAFSTEVDAHTDTDARDKLQLEILGGVKDFDLDASLGHQAEQHTTEVLTRHSLVIASVSELHPELGPTAPETESRCLKKVAMEKANLLVIITDWIKLATPPINDAQSVFPQNDIWQELLKKRNIWIISALPSNTEVIRDEQEQNAARILLNSNVTTYELGRQLATSQKKGHPALLKLHEKYALNVFMLSVKDNVNFVEVR